MSWTSWPVFRSGIFKSIKYLFTAQARAQRVLYASEMGVVSLDSLPMAVAYMSKKAEFLTWLVVHTLKCTIAETGESVLIISERNYIPADPFGQFTEEDRRKLQPLDELAVSRYDHECAKISEESAAGPMASIYRVIVVACICIIVLIVVFSLKK